MSLPVTQVQVDLAWLDPVTEQDVEGSIAVEIAQRHALSSVTAGVERDGRWREGSVPVV